MAQWSGPPLSDVSINVVIPTQPASFHGEDPLHRAQSRQPGGQHLSGNPWPTSFTPTSQHLQLKNSTRWNSSCDIFLDDDNMTSSINSTESPETDFSELYLGAQKGYIVLYALLVVVAVVGNSCTVYVVLSRRKMKNVTNYFIASLAVSDVFMGLVHVPFSFVVNVLLDYWPFGVVMCHLQGYVGAAIVFQSSYTLLAMSLERYIAIMHPFMRRLGKKRCLQIVAICWLLAFLTPIPTAVTSQIVELTPGNNSSAQGIRYCLENWSSDPQQVSYTITIMVLQYFVPLAVLIFTYAKIVHVVWLKDTPPTPGQVINHQESMTMVEERPVADPRKKVIKMMITVVTIYATCWLPLHVMNIVNDIDSSLYDWPYMRFVWIGIHWLAMSSCAYNPFIYWWMNPKFREGYLILFHDLRAWLFCLCRIKGWRKESLTSLSSRRFNTRLGNGSIFTQVSRRQSNTSQMVDMTALSCDTTPRKNGYSGPKTPDPKSQKDLEYQLSKISEVTENGTSPSVEKSRKSSPDDDGDTPFYL